MRTVAMRDQRVLLKVAAAASTRVADEISARARFRSGRFGAVSVRLRAIEKQRDRDIDRLAEIGGKISESDFHVLMLALKVDQTICQLRPPGFRFVLAAGEFEVTDVVTFRFENISKVPARLNHRLAGEIFHRFGAADDEVKPN